MTHSLKLEADEGGRVLKIIGDADMSAADSIEAAIARAVAKGGKVLTIDLEQTTMLDSRTIGVLVDWSGRLRQAGGSMPIVCFDDNILRLFSALGLEDNLDFADRDPD